MIEAQKLTQKYLRRVRKWHADWVANEALRKVNWDEPQETLTKYLSDIEQDGYLALECRSLNTWHLVHFGQKLIDEDAADPRAFALAARYAHASVKFNEAFADRNRGGDVSIRHAALYLALNVLCGWREESASVGNALVKGLDTPMLDLAHNDRHQKGVLFPAFWFVIQLYCQMSGRKLDVSKYSYPKDMHPYSEVLADWQTSDDTKITRWVSAMADYHLHEARSVPHDEIAQFDDEYQMIFPYEILFWLRLREWAGLVNPDSFDHPLMKLPTAQLPNPVPLPQPETPLLDAVVARFKEQFPGSFES